MRLQGRTYQQIADVIEDGNFLYRGETIPPVGRKVYKQQVHSTLLGQRSDEVTNRLRRSMWSNIIDEADAHAGTQLRKLVELRDAATAAAKTAPTKGPDKARLLKTAADIQQQVIELSRAAAGSLTVRTTLSERGTAQTIEARQALEVDKNLALDRLAEDLEHLIAADLITPELDPLLRKVAALIHMEEVKAANPAVKIELEALAAADHQCADGRRMAGGE